MTKQLTLVPKGWPCKLIDCPPGLFSFTGDIGFKSEYSTNEPNSMEVFCADSGEAFWGGTSDKDVRASLMVQPLIMEWVEL